MNSEFSFVILHYKALESTIMCIESILNKVGQDSQIIVVDNFSNNNSIEEIENKYNGFSNIYILKAKENLGFANGNNMGYYFAKNKLKSKYIVIMNNDIELIDSNFTDVIQEEYKKHNYAVMGPKIVLKDNTSFLYHRNIELKTAKKEKRNCIIKKTLVKMHLTTIYNVIIQRKKKSKEKNNLDYNKEYENIILHGSCLIFSPLYIEKFEEAFNKETFLYYEEELLYLKLMRNKLKTLYSPKTEVKHYEDVATNQECSNNEIKKNIFKLKNQIKSLDVVIKELLK